jgi:formate/nitrite transporter FocA (FNT family)
MSAERQPEQDPAASQSIDLRDEEATESIRRSAPRAAVLHDAIRREGLDELARSPSALLLSALAAGLSMGFSMLAQAELAGRLPADSWRPLITSFGYSAGFVIVVLGRQQLFTENTLTPVLPLLDRPNRKTLYRMLRLWLTVFVGNIGGAAVFALAAAHTSVVTSDIKGAMDDIARAANVGAGAAFTRGIVAGWLIALMVWMLPSAENTRLHTVILMSYLVGVGGFSHVIAGSVEVLYGCWRGSVPWHEYFFQYLPATLTGNMLGGLALVTALNHGQVVSGDETDPSST